MHTYTEALRSLFEKNANPTLARSMAAYMRNQFQYLGIKSPQLAVLQQQLNNENGLPTQAELESILFDLWSLPEREFQYAALGLLGKYEEKIPEEFIETLETLLVTKSWWDTVDTLSSKAVGTHFRRYPNMRAATVERWRRSDNFWLRRTTLLFQLSYKKDTDFVLLCDLIRDNLGSKEFFINKAIGWSLRQYSRFDEQAVRNFVGQTNLHPLSRREALRWLEKHGNES